MSSNFLKKFGLPLGALAGIVVAAGMFASRAQADQWDKMTLLTFDQPTQVGNTYLEPGTYMLKLANSDRHIVQIFNRDRSHLINTIIAIPSYRVFPTGNTQISYWETPPGTAKAVRDWYYPGDDYGQEFRYPTDLRQVAALTPPAPAPQPPPPVVESAPPPAAEPEPPAPQALEQAPAPAPPPVEIAQNTPQEAAPPPPAAAPAPQPPAQDQPLPQTASPYPLIGLAGLFALGLFGALRFSTNS